MRVAAVFGTMAAGHPLGMLRRRLRDLCVAAPAHVCTYLAPYAGSRTGPPLAFHSEAAGLYWRSDFCLMPGGDCVTRKAAMDALLLGCASILMIFFNTDPPPPWEPFTEAHLRLDQYPPRD